MEISHRKVVNVNGYRKSSRARHWDGLRYFSQVRVGKDLTVRLPPEIMVEIFTHHIAGLRGDYLDASGRNNVLYSPWLIMTHVCHRWREIALAAPTLWTYLRIGCGHVDQLEVFLLRSKNASLQIDIPFGMGLNQSSILRKIIPQSIRASSLDIRLSEGDLRPYIAHFPSSTPRLLTLGIHDPSSRGDNLSSLPICISDTATPKLKSLAIFRYRVMWNRDMFPISLTYLTVEYRSHDECKSTCSDVVGALENLVNLECLELRYVLSSVSEGSKSLASPAKVVALPKLQKICMSGSTLTNVVFLSHFNFPASAAVDLLSGNSPPCRVHEVPLLIDPLITQLSTRVLDDAKDAVVEVSIAASCVTFFRTPPKSPGQIRPILPVDSSQLSLSLSEAQNVFLAMALPRLPVRSATLLTLWSIPIQNPRLRMSEWVLALNAMSEVRSLRICCNFKPRNLHMILFPPAGLGFEASSHILPVLEEIRLSKVEFHRQHFNVRYGWEMDRDFTMSDGLCELVRVRQRAGLELKRIILTECRGSCREDVERLQRVVSVEWDGWTGDEGVEHTPGSGCRVENFG